MAGRLEGKVALITGTGGGQGRAAAVKFAQEGATIVGCDVKTEGNEETVRLVEQAGGGMTGMAPVDLGDPDQAKQWVDAAAAVHGRVDILYNNAGAARFGAIEDFSVDDWNFAIRNELDLVYYVTKAAWPYLKDGGGVVISTASVAGWVASGSDQTNGGSHAHNATKAAIHALTRAFAVQGAKHGIRAVSISPGPIETPATARLFSDDEVRKAMLGMILLDRLGQPEDIANAAAFLCSDEASFITGADLIVDGGLTAI